jgi:NAD(P)-dependent dehydrogenase (short-subunit alcohol dehydrogenase family)
MSKLAHRDKVIIVTGNVATPPPRSMLPPDAGPDQLAPHPTGRLARPAEIAAPAPFLLGDECPFMTGAAPAVDGGFTAQ